MRRDCKYIFSALVSIMLLWSSCSKDTQIGMEQSRQFVKFFGGSESDAPKDLISCNGGYAITGTMNSSDSANQAFVILTDGFGNETLTKPVMLGGKYNDIGNEIIDIGGGDLILVGTITQDAGASNTDVLVSRIKLNGSVVWTKFYGGNLKEEGLCGFKNSSGNIIVCGYTESSGNGAKDVYVLKLDTDGNVIWSSALGGVSDDIGYDITEVNNNLVVAGSTQSFNFSEKKMDIFLVSVDNATGKALGFRTLGDSINEKGIKIISLPDNDMCVLAQKYGNTVETNQISVYRINSSFTEKWNKTIPVTDTYEVGSDLFVYNNTIHILGTCYQNQSSDLWIHKLDENGSLISSLPIISNNNQVGFAGMADSEGRLLYVGSKANSGYQQIFFIKGLPY